MIEIEHNIPVPSTKSQGLRTIEKVFGADYKLPFDNMDVSDSFLIPKDKSEHWYLVNTVSSLARVYGKKDNKKFKTQKTPEGIRCWRVL